VYAVAGGGRAENSPGWRVRVVPNKYPALSGESGRHEVVVHSPRHVTSVADLDDAELADVARAWSERARSARADGFPYVHALLNEGHAAGGSLPHSHSQLVWLRRTPPAVAGEHATRLAAILGREAAGGRVVAERDGLVSLCPAAGRAPYEVLIAPVRAEADPFASPLLPASLSLLADAIRRIHAVEGRVPLNAWLHAETHWHIELVPRLTIPAGLELGAGVFVNPLPPEKAALRLRSV
jgi:UDPglucose--hexose-1-phosphate uridylyltransferase